MPYCVVKRCKNTSESHRRNAGLSFHKFPMEPNLRQQWTKTLRKNREDDSWIPSAFSLICSAHFQEKDLYNSKSGLRRLRKNAVPTLNLIFSTPTDIDSPNSSCSTKSKDNPTHSRPSSTVGLPGTSANQNSSSLVVASSDLDSIFGTTQLSDVSDGQSSSGTGESNTKGRASTCRSTKLLPLLKSSEDIIASVYNYLKAEYKQLKSSIGTSCDLSPLANILQRTAAATGVSEQAVSAILDERKRSADEELAAGAAKRANLSHDYGDGNVSPITDDESSCEAPDTEQDHVTEQDDNNEETQASQEPEEPEVETLKVEIKEEEDDKPVDPLIVQMNETDSAVQHLIFSSNSNRSNISITTDTNSALVRNPPAAVVYPQSRSGVQRVMSQEPLSSLATVKIEPIDDAHHSSEVKTEPPPS